MLTQSEQQFIATDGKPVFYRSAAPDNPAAAVILLHGIGEHSGRYGHVMTGLAAQGFAVYAPDHRGHGKTAEKKGYVASFDRITADIGELSVRTQEKHPSLPLFILGHSMGGLLAVLVLIEHQELFHGAVLSAAAVAIPENVSPLLLKAASFLSRTFPRLPIQAFDYDHVCRDPEVIQSSKSDPLCYRGKIMARTGNELVKGVFRARSGMKTIRLPLLILHGGADVSVPPEASRYIEAGVSSQDRTLLIFPGLFHEILNEPEKQSVQDTVTSWLKDRVSVPGSAGRR